VSNYAENKSSATYLSNFLLFPKRHWTKDDFLPPWLLEKQWSDFNEENKQDFLNRIIQCGLRQMSYDDEIHFPVAIIGKLKLVDSDEITMYRGIQNLMRKYYLDSDMKTPLGLAVFGSPGTGKSFGITELAKTVFDMAAGGNLRHFECNLSQFKHPEELSRELLDVLDVSRTPGHFPVIFLDEFDSSLNKEPFGWIKYLLALLQDGAFRYDGTLYHLGKAFIICAGGLNRSFQEFAWKSRDPQFRHTKIPDLVSRLRGHINIKGPNPYFPFPSETEPHEDSKKQFEMVTLENYDRGILNRSRYDWKDRVEQLANLDPLYWAGNKKCNES